MRHHWPILLMLALLGAGMAQAETVSVPDFALADRLNPEDPLAPATRTLPGDVELREDVVYATVPGYRRLRLDLYTPAAASAPLPLIVFVHGGGWKLGNPRAGGAFRSFPEVLAWLAGRGYVVASIEYRLSGEAVFPAPLHDLQAALGYLRGNATVLHLDPARVGLWGMSAGAYLSALEAVGCKVPALAPPAAPSGATGAPDRPCVQALVAWFGAYDLASHDLGPLDTATIRGLLGCGSYPCSSESLAAASPVSYVAAGDPPTLLLHGASDRLPAAQSQQFAERLRGAGVPVELRILTGVDHGFVGTAPERTREANREALEATAEFFDAQLRPGVAGGRQ